MFILVLGIIASATGVWLTWSIKEDLKMAKKITIAEEQLQEEQRRQHEIAIKADVKNLKTQNDESEKEL
jgi:hypothetical protein